MVYYSDTTEILQPFSPSESESPQDISKAGELLHNVVGRRGLLSSHQDMLDDLTAYEEFMGGKFGSFSVYRDGKDTIRALAYIARYTNSIELTALSVDKEERRRGLGRAVLREIISEADDSGHPIWLHTHRGNDDARRFFGRFGFEILPDSDYRQSSEGGYIALERPSRAP